MSQELIPFHRFVDESWVSDAFRAGMKYAYRHHYECAIQLDADGQHLPEYIPALEKAIETSDIAIGSRFILGALDRCACWGAI